MRLLFLIIVVLSFGVSPAKSEPPPLSAYGDLPMAGSFDISPDGSKVAMLIQFSGKFLLTVSGVDGVIIKFLDFDDVIVRAVSFIDDNNVLLRASPSRFGFGIEVTSAEVISLDGSKTRYLFRRTIGVVPALIGEIVGRDVSTGNVLVPARSYAKPYRGWVYNLFSVKLKTGKGRVYSHGTRDTIDWFVGEDGNILAREMYNNTTNVYRVQRYAEGWKTIFEEECDRPCLSIVGLAADAEGLVFAYGRLDDDTLASLSIMSFSGEISDHDVFQSDHDIEHVYTDHKRQVVGVRFSGSRPTYQFRTPKIQASIDFVQAQFPDGTIVLDSWSTSQSVFLYQIFAPGLGDVLMVHNAETDALTVVLDSRPNIPAEALARTALVNYSARDGLNIEAIVTLPEKVDDVAQVMLPLIVMPHGGPASYDDLGFDWMAQFFASRGYVVLQPNFRGSSGYGREFYEAGHGEWGRKMQDDITDGVFALSENGLIDRNRVCIVGASYGGYAALAGAVFTPGLYKCVVAISPVSDINLMLRNTRRDYGRKHWVVDYWNELIRDDDKSREKLKSISPINFVDRVEAPILLLHGEADTVVDIEQSERMHRALSELGKDVTFIRLENEDHWLSISETRLELLREIDQFIGLHLPVDIDGD